MAKFTLQSNEKFRKNSKVVVIHAGVIEFNADGIAQIELSSENQLNDVLKSLPDAFVPSADENTNTGKGGNESGGSQIKPQVTENELGKSKDDENDLGGNKENENDFTGNVETEVTGSQGGSETSTTSENESANTQDIAATLQGLGMVELKQLAADSGFPEAEWKGFRKEEKLREYLNSKLQPQA